MFEAARRDPLLSKIILHILLAISLIVLPTAILLGIIGGHTVEVDGGAAIVDASLGAILVFSSLAAVSAPFVYRNSPR